MALTIKGDFMTDFLPLFYSLGFPDSDVTLWIAGAAFLLGLYALIKILFLVIKCILGVFDR